MAARQALSQAALAAAQLQARKDEIAHYGLARQAAAKQAKDDSALAKAIAQVKRPQVVVVPWLVVCHRCCMPCRR